MIFPVNLNIKLNPDAVIAPLINVLDHSSKNVLLGLQLIESAENLIDINEIKSENTFFTMHFAGSSGSNDITDNKENFKVWVMQKAFEDLIKGVNLALIEAYFFSSIVIRNNSVTSFKEFQDKINQLRKSATKQHLPELLQNLKPNLTDTLSFEIDILSINKVRNCLVHRNGIVTEVDLTDKNSNVLRVEYTRMKFFYEKHNEEIEVNKLDLVPGEFDLLFKTVKAFIDFKLGERIKFNYQQFNALLATCLFFGQDLVKKLPTITIDH
jgi:hypothetical protein